jgi:hypothetical protein
VPQSWQKPCCPGRIGVVNCDVITPSREATDCRQPPLLGKQAAGVPPTVDVILLGIHMPINRAFASITSTADAVHAEALELLKRRDPCVRKQTDGASRGVETVAVSVNSEVTGQRGLEDVMQTVELFDGVRDHAFTITDVRPYDGGFEVAVRGPAGGQAHRFAVHADDGSLRVTHGSSPAVEVGIVHDRYADQLRVTWAGGGHDVSGHGAVAVLQLTGTVSDDDEDDEADVRGHLGGSLEMSAAVLAASSAYMLVWQLPGSDAAQPVSELIGDCRHC